MHCNKPAAQVVKIQLKGCRLHLSGSTLYKNLKVIGKNDTYGIYVEKHNNIIKFKLITKINVDFK